jgi:hypothetical protein
LKGIVYIRGNEESHLSKRKFFHSKDRDPITAVGLLDASKHNSLSWKVIQLCINEEEEEEEDDHMIKHDAHSADSNVPNVNSHCAEASCPLNNISSMTGQYSGDFDLNQIKSPLSLSQHYKDTDETMLPYETISSHLESKIFIIGKKLPPYTVVMPRFRSFLVPDNFVEIGDEEIEFNGSNCELRINVHGLTSSSSSMVSDTIAEEEVEEVLVAKAVVDEKVTFHARAVNNKTKVFQIVRMFNGSLYMSTNEM